MYGLTSLILAGDTYKAFELAPRILAGIVNGQIADRERRDSCTDGWSARQRLGSNRS
jgi:hypothetical protein